MGNVTTALVFVMLLNVLMFLTQASMIALNSDSIRFYDVSGSIIEGMNIDKDINPEDKLPSLQDIQVSSGNPFTDIFNSIISWFKTSTGLSYIYGIVTAPYQILKALGLPTSVAWGLGALWYGISLFCVIAFAFGREN